MWRQSTVALQPCCWATPRPPQVLKTNQEGAARELVEQSSALREVRAGAKKGGQVPELAPP